MKKAYFFILVVVLLFGMSVNAFASSPPKNVEVSITSSLSAVRVGETVTLTAVTLKHGSEYKDEWVGATKVSTVLTEDGYYVSTARITVQDDVLVQYNIIMNAGNNVSFAGATSISVEADQPVDIVGAEIKNVTPVPGITGFYTGYLFIIFSDGTLAEYGSIYFGLGETQTSKTLYIPVSVSGLQYDFAVEVSR